MYIFVYIVGMKVREEWVDGCCDEMYGGINKWEK